ncbi:hypothetical protein BV22DRAFT_1040463 [Leucogyrophana mollusca]|uniref:Uncharacterized protein n=1 Tax=Leucogyrophana mollusca TaxID=85980 RepID=A0ACB8B2C8_9AGAM|nr:hypothetical protein BV22DRAFT_1040463 [Leucogyrophana mollusca]
MISRQLLARRLAAQRFARLSFTASLPRARLIASNMTPGPAPTSPQQSWLTKKVKSSPALLSVFLGVARVLGYGSPQQLANRRALYLYNSFCASRADEQAQFWRNECALPATFQSWFTITNLHVWLLTVRLRALPAPHGSQHIQGLIDHFFQDVEERVRAVLQPGVLPPRLPPSSPSAPSATKYLDPTSPAYLSPYSVSTFYHTPIPPPPSSLTRAELKAHRRAQAPERVVTRQMKIFREQWAGLGIALDLGLVRGDAEMAGAIWRNLLGGRGARGIDLGENGGQEGFRRSVNLVGGLVESVKKVDKNGGIEAEESKDDESGVCDFPRGESDRYLPYPALMSNLVEYLRRETSRMEALTDAAVMGPRKMGREAEGLEVVKAAGGVL